MRNFLVPYQPEWKTEFENLSSVLQEALNAFETDIQQVGSTAVPGVYSKPILDIDIIITDEAWLTTISGKLKTLGYNDKGDQGIPGRFAFRQSTTHTPVTPEQKQWMEHHLYVCFSGSLAVKNHLLFRDALLADKVLAEQYSALKKTLMGEKGMTREIYSQRKTGFILSVLSSLGLD
ncbi:MAG TPA: GrpB family protein, partial [Chitinophagaceae bacterium]|nr:GrpB family protein [Chitinophagaceae bacterium]